MNNRLKICVANSLRSNMVHFPGVCIKEVRLNDSTLLGLLDHMILQQLMLGVLPCRI
jgi:hypothetical protein